ncbi:calcium ATPase [Coemansia reversa NRRL 1564]|uniref:Calcium ATPase n=1 Tax=Coemansia reversa (strain ATCC 12441 / NRRL 1564) TaxID=763665 RepID=A0A2G5B9U3_COERN|nr:calcium ATPase [Coemansia reversa NRRL 1564]|eukprot:PIA15781.1 calcium ATPase [Coemansia reversa NRRL 1564]
MSQQLSAGRMWVRSRGSPHAATEFRTLSIQIRDTEERRLQRQQSLQSELTSDLRNTRYHLDPIPEVLAQLGTSQDVGLTKEAAAQALGRHGRNEVGRTSRMIPQRVFRWFCTGFNRFLWLAMVVFWLCWKPIGDPPQSGNLAMAVVVILVIGLQALFAVWQEWTTQRAMHAISSMMQAECTVLRDGVLQQIAATELVPGDIVQLRADDRVAADMRLIEVSMDVMLDRSELSGTPHATIGSSIYTSTNYLETRNMAMMGASVTQGQCTGVVVATGGDTVLGRISSLLSNRPAEQTILQLEVRRLVNGLTTVSLVVGTVFVVLWAAWLRTAYPGFMSVSDALANGVGVLVTFVPGSLPISLTLALTTVAKRLQRHRVLIKNLTTVEMLGAVNVICCEKTGTLTQRRVRVTNVGFADDEMSLERLLVEQSAAVLDALPLSALRLHETAALCNDAAFDEMTMHMPASRREVLGDATDSALLRMAEQMCPLAPARQQYTMLLKIPFSLRRRWMLVVCKRRDSEPFVLVKGAPERLLPHCSTIQASDGAIWPIDERMRSRMADMQLRWANRGCRVLLLCRRDFIAENGKPNPLAGIADNPAALYEVASRSIDRLCVVGMVGMVDPPREEIPSVVGIFRSAGVRVFMVTGDYAPTAAYMARQCGIITSAVVDGVEELQTSARLSSAEKEDSAEQTLACRRSLVISGAEMAGLSPKLWDAIAQYEEIVFARITPEQKLQVVEEMRARGSIVAVTGDDANDLPAMRAAHVGVAMGNGSAVSREAAEMVLLDNNFSSMVAALEAGRLVFVNLKKVIVYLLPMTNMSEIMPSFLNVVLGLPIPLSTFLMLVINTITDVWASIVLLREEPETDILHHPPRNPKKEPLVDVRFFVHAYLFIGLIQTVTGHVMFFLCIYLRSGISPGHVFLAFNKWTDGYMGKSKQQLADIVSVAGSAHFMALVVMQWANMFAARTRSRSLFRQNPLWGPKRNPLLLVSIPISVMVALFFNQIRWFNVVFLTGNIPVEFFFLPIPFACALLALEELRKLLLRRFPHSLIARMAW